jgi:hypothetical protein
LDFARLPNTAKGSLPSEKAGFNRPLMAGCGIVLATNNQGRIGRTVAISADKGQYLWLGPFADAQFARGGGPFFIDGLVWTLDSDQGVLRACDPQTGALVKVVFSPGIRYTGHHARCYLARATSRYILAKERGADFVDLSSGAVAWNNWLRGSCHRGVMPANGLLYSGQHSCRCYTEAALHGFFALAPARSTEVAAAEKPAERQPEKFPLIDGRLQRGAAYEARNPSGELRRPDTEIQSPGDWPTYRHDPLRSGGTSTPVSEDLAPMWSAALGGKLTAPVAAAGRVYAAAVDQQTIYALDAASGSQVWAWTAGGRIDSPPTVHQGLVLFGCRDGWVYCLRAEDGELAWRFRAAPEERMVGAGGQLESAWPVPGSILVKDNVAYCVAGRSSYLDGGLYLYALDPVTGELLHTRRLDGPWPGPEIGASPETPNRGFTSEGALPDVLVADAGSIYLRHLRFDPTLQRVEDMQPNFYKSPQLTGENRGGDHKYWDDHLESPPTDARRRHAVFIDYRWFNRSFFQNFPGLRLYATTGLLDDSWHRRMYWSYGQVVGQYIVFRGTTGYAVQVFATSPREGGFNAGDGYVVYAGRTAEREIDKKLFALRPDESLWRIRVPFRPVAMILAGDRLILAGPPDLANPTEALAAIEGRKGGVMWILDAENGRKLSERRLESPPGYDGMAAARGHLYLATVDGKILCLGKQSAPGAAKTALSP